MAGGKRERSTAPGAASAARAGVRISVAGRSAVFRRRRYGPALLREAPRCSCPAVACGDRGVSNSTWADGLLFGADGVAVTVSQDRTAGMPPWPPRLPHTPRQSRLRCGTPSPSPRAPRTFLKVSRGRRLPYLMAMSSAIGRMAHRVRSAPAARRSSGMADPCPRGCISRRSSAILAYRANCASAPGRRHPRAMSGAPAPDFHRLSGLPVCRDGSRPRRHRAAPTWPLQ